MEIVEKLSKKTNITLKSKEKALFPPYYDKKDREIIN